ncbi:MAG TPA: MarR family winged helix-turn-helix transcriptional regulator [Gammaproteobacteria bacterium]|jgi:DNA-binding MarR family transcriptional regulator|nr:MarR family winged helix-turn-helix transcriptional regulator [Gammaproteobacteria bacterium]
MTNHHLQLQDLVNRLGNRMRTEVRQGHGTERLQPVHMQALNYLQQCNRYSNTPLALTEYLGLTKGTVSQSLLLLHRKGLIERSSDPVDNRVVRLRLSAKGEKLLKQQNAASEWKATTKINNKKLESTANVLGELLQALQVSHGARTFGSCTTCRYFKGKNGSPSRCGLTGERLYRSDIGKICREHAVA